MNLTPKILLITLLIISFRPSILSQSIDLVGGIKGTIIDNTTLQPLPYANILIEELGLGTSTDDDGAFYLEQVPEGKYNLTASYLGYQDKIITEVRVVRDKIFSLEIKLDESKYELDQVNIKAYRYEDISSMPTSTFSMSREEIFRSPASNGNIFRAISAIPGVQSGGGSFAALAVRGQGTDQNAMFVDDFPVFELSHLSGGFEGGFDDPQGGRFSIFGPRVIDGLVLQTGGFSSLYGRKSSSYLGLTVKEGNPDDNDVDILLSLTGASASYSGSLGSKTTLFTSVRYQNFVPALNLTNQGELGKPSFADLTLKSVTKINKKNKLTFLALLNPEQFKRETDNIIKDPTMENTWVGKLRSIKGVAGLKLRTLLNENSNMVNLVYYRNKTVDINFGEASPRFTDNGEVPLATEIPFNDEKGSLNTAESEIGYRLLFTKIINSKTTFRSGIDLAAINIDHSRLLNEPDTTYSFYRQDLPLDQTSQNYLVIKPQFFDSEYEGSAFNGSAYANLQTVPLQNLVLNAGLRYDHTGFSEQGKLSPRLSLQYRASEKTTINAATGLYYQDPLFINIADNNGVKLAPERAIHYIGGVKHYFTSDLKFMAEIYYKQISNLIVRSNTTINALVNQGEGEAYGIDISLVKRLSNKYNGQISYSYSQSTRNNFDGIGQYDHLYSQPHVVNLLLSFQPTHDWMFSAKIRTSTGQPTNSAQLFTDVLENEDNLKYGLELLGRNDIRNDHFVGIDLRMDRRIAFGKRSLNLFVDIQNVLNRENAATRTFFETTGNYEPQALGILPTVGWRLEL